MEVVVADVDVSWVVDGATEEITSWRESAFCFANVVNGSMWFVAEAVPSCCYYSWMIGVCTIGSLLPFNTDITNLCEDVIFGNLVLLSSPRYEASFYIIW